MLGRHCCTGFFSVAESGGYSLGVVHGTLTAVTALTAEHRLYVNELPQLQHMVSVVEVPRLQCTGSIVALRCWDLPRPGIELKSPALAGRFFTTELPEKPLQFFFNVSFSWDFPGGLVVKILCSQYR